MEISKPKILLCTADEQLASSFAGSVGAEAGLVVTEDIIKYKDSLDAFNLVVMDQKLISPDKTDFFLKGNIAGLIVREELTTSIEYLSQFPSIRHILGTDPPSKNYWRYVAQSLQPQNEDPHVQDLLHRPQYCESRMVSSYDQKNSYLDWVRSKANSLGCFSDFGNMAASIAWELLMNACSRQSYLGTGQVDESVLLEPGENTFITVGYDDNMFLVSVKDPFGLLRRDDVVKNLQRCSKQGHNQILFNKEGAGIGLYMLLGCASFLIFDVFENQSTEVTVGMKRTKSNKNFDKQARSISFIKRSYHKD